ncbi:YcjF family protein [Altericista sp. CCNU0014]|uniref:YcjF family protein n=1 Tax=Altericista sp. CCNU0014 TaxID=3082949 RepID=UPI00384CDB23
MRVPRLALLAIGASAVLGLMLWLTNTLLQLYASVAATSVLLANVLIAGIAVLFLLLMGVLVYYGIVFSRPRRKDRVRKAPVKLPEQKSAVVDQTLQAVRRQVATIQDEVERQALLLRSQELERSLKYRELHIVVFGTGSAGKTSLVNALLGRVAGAVSPIMGTTTVGETYQFDLKGIQRELHITDTPGLLEVGVAGTERERAARQLATEADLLLFVVDGDLTQSEYQALKALQQIGKRFILVFNKIDRYPAADRNAILQRLQERVPDADIVAIAAAPLALRLATGETVQPNPDIVALLRQMVLILRSEGEELLADNILLQATRLGDDVKQLMDEQRLRQANRLVDRFQWIGAGAIWITPLPVVDLLATAVVNAQMVVELGRVYGCEMDLERGKELALSLAKTLAGVGIVTGVMEVVTTALELSVGGYVVGKSIQSVSAAYLTRIAGKSFIQYFRNDQDWGDGGITAVVKQQFELNRRDEFVKAFVKEAIAQLPKDAVNLLNPQRLQNEPENL